MNAHGARLTFVACIFIGDVRRLVATDALVTVATGKPVRYTKDKRDWLQLLVLKLNLYFQIFC